MAPRVRLNRVAASSPYYVPLSPANGLFSVCVWLRWQAPEWSGSWLFLESSRGGARHMWRCLLTDSPDRPPWIGEGQHGLPHQPDKINRRPAFPGELSCFHAVNSLCDYQVLRSRAAGGCKGWAQR